MTPWLSKVAAAFVAPRSAGRTAGPAPVPPSAGVVAAERDLGAAAGAVAARLRAGEAAAAAVVCLWRPARDLPPPPAPVVFPAAARLVSRLAGRDLAARACGALCVVELPDDPADAAAASRRAYAAADVPVVVAVARRSPELDAVLAMLDEVVLGAAGPELSELESLALASIEQLGPRSAAITVPRGLLRPVAVLGLGADARAAHAPTVLCEVAE